MSFETVDRLVRMAVDSIRQENKSIIDALANGESPGDLYFTHTGMLRGLALAEEKIKEAGRNIMREDEIEQD